MTWLGWSEKNCVEKGGKGQVEPREESLGEVGRGWLPADLGSPAPGPDPIFGQNVSERLKQYKLFYFCSPLLRMNLFSSQATSATISISSFLFPDVVIVSNSKAFLSFVASLITFFHSLTLNPTWRVGQGKSGGRPCISFGHDQDAILIINDHNSLARVIMRLLTRVMAKVKPVARERP